MKLELKHLVGYLPYGLKIMTDYDGIQEIQGMPDLFHVNYYDNESDNGDEPHIEDIKPILHPLSDLTKEIEVNGEKFVPLTEICNCEYYGYSELRSMVQNNNFLTCFIQFTINQAIIDKLIFFCNFSNT